MGCPVCRERAARPCRTDLPSRKLTAAVEDVIRPSWATGAPREGGPRGDSPRPDTVPEGAQRHAAALRPFRRSPIDRDRSKTVVLPPARLKVGRRRCRWRRPMRLRDRGTRSTNSAVTLLPSWPPRPEPKYRLNVVLGKPTAVVVHLPPAPDQTHRTLFAKDMTSEASRDIGRLDSFVRLRIHIDEGGHVTRLTASHSKTGISGQSLHHATTPIVQYARQTLVAGIEGVPILQRLERSP